MFVNYHNQIKVIATSNKSVDSSQMTRICLSKYHFYRSLLNANITTALMFRKTFFQDRHRILNEKGTNLRTEQCKSKTLKFILVCFYLKNSLV